MKNPDTGPMYGVLLLDVLPLGRGCMKQQMPSRSDLEGIKDIRQGQRVVAGYEVLLWHYRRARGVVNTLADKLAGYTGGTSPKEIRLAEAEVDQEAEQEEPGDA